MANTLDTTLRFSSASANPLTSAYTCGAGTTALILLIVIGGPAPAIARAGGAPTYNGVAFTLGIDNVKVASTNETVVEAWYMLAPPTGSSLTISIPNSTPSNIAATAVSVKAGSGISAFDTTASGTGTSTNPGTVTYTPTQVNTFVAAIVGTGAQTWAPSARTGTLIADTDFSSWGDGEQYFILTTTAGQSVGWTFGTSDDWGIAAIGIYEFLPPKGPHLHNVDTLGSILKPHAFSPGNAR